MARIARITGGILLVLAGVVMLAIPGPGILTIAAGVVLLSKDVPAAERLVGWAKAKLARGEGAEDDSDEMDLA